MDNKAVIPDFAKRAAEAANAFWKQFTDKNRWDVHGDFIAGAKWAAQDIYSKLYEDYQHEIDSLKGENKTIVSQWQQSCIEWGKEIARLKSIINEPHEKNLHEEIERLKDERDTLKAELERANIKIEELTKRDFKTMMKSGLYEAEAENARLREALEKLKLQFKLLATNPDFGKYTTAIDFYTKSVEAIDLELEGK